jgi:23S rRNA (guanine745-N1)-methyltransferase
MTSLLQCPVCRERLLLSADGYQCSRHHTFDAARQGYVNFLLAHKKHSKEPGDSPEMIKSRRRFLGLGYYDKISAGINQVVADIIQESGTGSAVSILDAGCGEGYYLKRLKDTLTSHPGDRGSLDCYGIDISKFAVRQATQRDKAISWFVASINDLPFAQSSLDIILNVFSPANAAEFSRILKESGRLVIVSPGPKHLYGLREIIYPVAREHAGSSVTEHAKGFLSLVSTAKITYPLELTSNGEIMDLLAMTPYYWNIDKNTKSKVEALDRLTLDVDVELRVFRKTDIAAGNNNP